MRRLLAALIIAAAPLGGLALVAPAAMAQTATVSALGDLSALRTIADDTLTIARTGDLAKAQARITDFESAWDKAAGDMQPKSPEAWKTVDAAADHAIATLRAGSPSAADVEAALTALIATLDNPGGDATPAAAPAAAAFAVTNADGSPLPCEVALKTLRDAAASKHPSDQAAYDTALNKGLDRCNADDDKRADGFFAAAFALLQ